MDKYKYDFNYPETLYKYIPSDRTIFFDNFGLRLTQKNDLNDPFEQSSIERSEFDNLSNEEKKSFLANCSNNHDHSKSLIRKIRTKKLSNPKYTNEGVISFSETPDNILLWALYSSDHKGFCIEFDASYFMGFENGVKKNPFNLLRLRYRDSRPELQNSSWHKWIHRTDENLVLSTKSSHWSHELEWRAHADLSNIFFQKDQDKQRPDLFIHCVPQKYIRKIIFGASCSIDSMLDIKNKIINNPYLNHISMKISVVDPIEFKVRLVNINIEDLNNLESNLNAA